MKPLRWLGDSKKAIQAFPEDAQEDAQSDAGFELFEVQRGRTGSDFKPMPSIGQGVEELRIWVESGTYRVIYVARLPEAVYVLHAFQKKSQQTNARDLLLARKRFEALLRSRK